MLITNRARACAHMHMACHLCGSAPDCRSKPASEHKMQKFFGAFRPMFMRVKRTFGRSSCVHGFIFIVYYILEAPIRH